VLSVLMFFFGFYTRIQYYSTVTCFLLIIFKHSTMGRTN